MADAARKRAGAFQAPASGTLTEKADLLLEIGTEELPYADLSSALTQLRAGAEELLSEARLEHGEVSIQGTPRRLTLMVRGLQTQQADRVLEVKGPPAARAFDAEGRPTKAAEGFARSRGWTSASCGFQKRKKAATWWPR